MSLAITPFKYSLLSIAIAAVTACGSGNDQVSDISGTGQAVISGPITGFGSVHVNGVHFITDDTAITIDNMSGKKQSDLHVGQWVTIIGEVDERGEGIATSLEFEESMKGPVTGIDISNNSITALGQTIIVDAITVFKGVSLETLTVADNITVSGINDAEGRIHATFIELLSEVNEAEIQGHISNLNSAEQTFFINDLLVNYSSASTIEIEASLQNGLFVNVEGNFDGTKLIAINIEQNELSDELSEDLEAEIEGIITHIDQTNQFFQLQGISVNYSAVKIFENGDATDLMLNAAVEVEGSINASGQLVASSIAFEAEDNVEVEGIVDNVDATAATVTVMGHTFNVDIDTVIFDERDQLTMFNLSSIVAGDYLEIQAYTKGSDTLIASALTRTESDTAASISGPVDTIDLASRSVSVLSFSYDLSDAAIVFENAQGLDVSAVDDFLSALQVGDILTIEGALENGFVIETVAVEGTD
ncbi:MAG: hypothetical protein HRU20_07355 [Pseudomonadales bacterium]|nr:hypothetical protein [Pseudomonadales bacterium]